MELESLNCNNCGAPLDVPASTNFVTCSHCNSRLTIKRTESVAYTEKIDEIDRRTEAMSEQIGRLLYQNEVARLDREWDREKEGFMTTDKQGRRKLPSEGGAVVMGAIAVVGGLVWMGFTASMPHSGAFPLFGLVFIAFGVIVSIVAYNKAKEYQRALRRYRRRRAAVTPESVAEEWNQSSETFARQRGGVSVDDFLGQLEGDRTTDKLGN